MTQQDLADQVYCSLTTIRRIGADVRRPSKQLAEQMADVLAIAREEREEAFVAFARRSQSSPLALPVRTDAATGRRNLPPRPTKFIGREQEVAHIAQRLTDPACQLLTLVGLGGVGKTRLAVEAAYQHSTAFEHGVFFVSLVPVHSADLLLFAIANALAFSFPGSEPPAPQLVNYLHDKSLLLVLDSFEHLLDSAPLLADLLAGAPHLTLLITSRERLNLHGEWVLPVEGMDYPRGLELGDLESYSAVQLFMQTAQRIQPGFSLRNHERGVLHICQLVEGLPLALELAAAWVRLLPPARIVEQLTDSLDFLASPLRNVPERHRSLRAVFDHSWRLLPDAEQTVLAKLSVFRGSFDLEAAQEIGGAALPVLASLVDKSLLRVYADGHYALHELLRQYAADQLMQRGIEVAHKAWAIDYLTRAAERASRAGAERQAVDLLGQAIAIAEESGHRAVVGDLHFRRGQALLRLHLWVEAYPEFEAAWAAAGSDTPDRKVQLLLDRALVKFWLHDAANHRQHVNEALTLAEAAQRGDLAVAAIARLGFVETNDGNLVEAVNLYEHALARAEAVHLVFGGDVHLTYGRTLYYLGRYSDALTQLRQAVDRIQGGVINRIFPLEDLGLALAATGQYTQAVQTFDEACQLCRQLEVWPLLARGVAASAGFHLDVFDYAGNEALAQEACMLARSADFVLPEVSASLDLLLNYARCQQVGRAEKLLAEIGEIVEKARDTHGWLWRLRLAQVQAELAHARGDWGETLRLVELALQHSRARGRVKYQAYGLKTRAQALTGLGQSRQPQRDHH